MDKNVASHLKKPLVFLQPIRKIYIFNEPIVQVSLGFLLDCEY